MRLQGRAGGGCSRSEIWVVHTASRIKVEPGGVATGRGHQG
ncbi:hypothetical protein PAMC26510_05050 [Caballeronia sordidicola]|uniref:Uncharacterized protein n=1 Tax=Caballeronia sordidicola TaxID=196367 RepID=A0A242N861_CABSO|nr:hypothetical protein PAMC26510_05050 [Caballeronia sordidicola]